MANRAPKSLRQFLKAEGGNAAMIVALALTPISLAALGAVDLSRATSAKVQMQDALDAAALAAGRTNTTDPAVLQAVGQHVLERFVEAKTLEWDSYRLAVSQWEIDRYLAIY